jgi:predicted ATPase
MISRFQVRNYKALQDVSLNLSPIHLLIGPNDSGKTSILEAVGAMCRSVDRPLKDAFEGSWEGRELVWQGASEPHITLRADVEDETGQFAYELEIRFSTTKHNTKIVRETFTTAGASIELPSRDHGSSAVARSLSGESFGNSDVAAAVGRIAEAVRGVQYFRWVPRMLALPAAPDASRAFKMDSTGFGLARCLDDILGYDRRNFTALEESFRRIFPGVETIRLKQESAFRSTASPQVSVPVLQTADGKGIYVKFRDQPADVPARQLSDGVLLVLAYLAILHLPEPPRVVLVEEPENGIHPARLGEVLNVLRSLVTQQAQTQLLLTTHSPYVVDLFSPDEVTLCVKQPGGAISARTLSESETVRSQIDVFTLGEIWTSEGDDQLLQRSTDEVESRG